jgi:hypothetical protein
VSLAAGLNRFGSLADLDAAPLAVCPLPIFGIRRAIASQQSRPHIPDYGIFHRFSE